MMGRSVKQAVCNSITAIVTTMLVLALTTRAAEAACPTSITKCGCTISAPGTYTITSGFSTVATGTCINITASNVNLTTPVSGFVFFGPGSNTPTFGIDIEASARNVTVGSPRA